MGKAVITGADGYTIGAHPHGGTLDGLWFWGNAGVSLKGQSLQVGSSTTIQNCVFINMPEAIDGINSDVLIKDCVFINCGWGRFSHSLYFSDTAAANVTLQDCVFIGGQAYHIHLWHYPSNMLIQGNFSAKSEWGLVLNGDGHVAQHNFFWSGYGKPGQEQLTWNFSDGLWQYDNNYAGEETETCPNNMGARAANNTFYNTSYTYGLTPISKTWADFTTKTTYTKAQIDTVVNDLDTVKNFNSSQILADTSVATNVATIKDMMMKLLA